MIVAKILMAVVIGLMAVVGVLAIAVCIKVIIQSINELQK